MERGKQTCRILKDIRRQIAEANDIVNIKVTVWALVPSAKPKYVIWNNSWNVNGWLEKP